MSAKDPTLPSGPPLPAETTLSNKIDRDSDFVSQSYQKLGMVLPHDPDGRRWKFETDNSQYFLDLRTLSVRMKLRVTQQDNTVLPPYARVPGEAGAEEQNISTTGKVALIPLIGQTMWRSVQLYSRGSLLSECTEDYPYLAFLKEVLLRDAKRDPHEAELAGFDVHSALSRDQGFPDRAANIHGSMEYTVMGRLVLPFLQADRYWPPHFHLEVNLERNNNNFLLENFDPALDPWVKTLKLFNKNDNCKQQ